MQRWEGAAQEHQGHCCPNPTAAAWKTLLTARTPLPPWVSLHLCPSTHHLLPELVAARTAPDPKSIKGKTMLGMCQTFRFSRTFYSPFLGFLTHMMREMTRKTTAPHTTAIRMTRYRDKPVLWESKAIQQKIFRQGRTPGCQQQVQDTYQVPEGSSSQPCLSPWGCVPAKLCPHRPWSCGSQWVLWEPALCTPQQETTAVQTASLSC